MHAGQRFNRLGLVDLIIEFAALLRNGEYAGPRHALERHGWRGVPHAHAQINIIAGIDQKQNGDNTAKNPLKNL